MKSQRQASQYVRTQIGSSTPLELVVLLYDGALRFTAEARDAMVRRDIPARREAISRALAIVAELQASLDLKRGGKIAADLDRLYTYVISRLVAATTEQRVAPIDEARKVLTGLGSAWRTISRRAPGGTAP